MRSEGEGSLGEDVVLFPQLNSTRKSFPPLQLVQRFREKQRSRGYQKLGIYFTVVLRPAVGVFLL